MDTADRILKDIMLASKVKGDKALYAALTVNPAIRNLAASYRRALKDGQTKLPSYLMAAIENLVRLNGGAK